MFPVSTARPTPKPTPAAQGARQAAEQAWGKREETTGRKGERKEAREPDQVQTVQSSRSVDDRSTWFQSKKGVETTGGGKQWDENQEGKSFLLFPDAWFYFC